MSGPTDQDLDGLVLLVSKIQEAERAYQAVHEHYEPKIKGWIRGRGIRDEGTIDYIATWVMFKAWRAIRRGQFVRTKSFFAYLVGIATHEVPNHFRDEGRHGRTTPFSQLVGFNPEDSHAAEQDEGQHPADEANGQVKELLARLPPRQRAILCLGHLCGWHYASIAEALGITVSEAYTLAHKAREMLRAGTGTPPREDEPEV